MTCQADTNVILGAAMALLAFFALVVWMEPQVAEWLSCQLHAHAEGQMAYRKTRAKILSEMRRET